MINIAEPWLGEKELEYVIECVKTNWISSQGKFVRDFEKNFADYCEGRYGIATSNGTTALHLALAALGIKEGDEVIIPALTFIATANVVRHLGAKPVLIDSDYETWNMDPGKIEEKITERTRAIMPVHMFGEPADMDPILDIAGKHKLHVVEDAAESHGAMYKGRKVGSIGDIGCFSFFGNKIITTGEGGMLVIKDEGIRDKSSILRDHGMSKEKRYEYLYIGYNYRMTNLQAAIGVAQLERIEENLSIRSKLAKVYYDELKDVEGLGFQPTVKENRHVDWFYNILIEKGAGISREDLIKALYDKGIDTRPIHLPIHKQVAYKGYFSVEMPVSEELSRKCLNLPCNPNITESQQEFIIGSIKETIKKGKK